MVRVLIAVFMMALIAGCSVNRLPESINQAITNNPDLEIVGQGLPTYLITLDGLVINYPKNTGLKQTAAKLNGAYATLFVSEPARKQQMVKKAYDLSAEAFCLEVKNACDLKVADFELFEDKVDGITREKDIEALYLLGSSWVGLIQENSDDWGLIADLARVQYIMEHIVNLNPGQDNGQALLYLGVLNSLIPPSLGGKPEVAKSYFENALQVSEGRNLLIAVYYARYYARLMFDQELHDLLLTDVIAADPEQKGLWLQNVYAQQIATELLAESADYF